MTSKREDGTPAPMRPATRLVTGGRDPFAQHGYVNPPVYHASTLLYRSAEDYLSRRSRYQYGRRGTPTSEALSGAIAELEGPACAGVALQRTVRAQHLRDLRCVERLPVRWQLGRVRPNQRDVVANVDHCAQRLHIRKHCVGHGELHGDVGSRGLLGIVVEVDT